MSIDTIYYHEKHFFNYTKRPESLFLSDAFNEYFYPQTGLDALIVLNATGCNIKLLATIGAGRTLITKGFLGKAKKHAKKLINETNNMIPTAKYLLKGWNLQKFIL